MTTSHNEHLAVLKQLLGSTADPEQIQSIMLDIVEQIQYSVSRFAGELEGVGYSPQYAKLIAGQIVPKPVMYSLIVGYRAGDTWRTDLVARKTDPLRRMAFRDLQYVMMAPAFISYLFDQTIDNYNADVEEEGAIEHEVQRVGQVLRQHPDTYLFQLVDLLQNVLAYGVSGAAHDPSLRPYWLLAPYIDLLDEAGIPPDEIVDVLYCVSDVLTHEHMALLSYRNLGIPQMQFCRVRDFVDDVTGVSHDPVWDSPEHTAARAMLRNQGYLLIAVNQYVLNKLTFEYDPDRRVYRPVYTYEGPSARQLLVEHDDVVHMMRQFEALVRAGDDIGDVPLDVQYGALNWVTAGEAVLDEFLELSGLVSGDISELRETFIHTLRTIVHTFDMQGALTTSYVTRLVYQLAPLHEVVQANIAAGIPDGPYAEDFQSLLYIIRQVVAGSIVNAQYNDSAAANLTTNLSHLKADLRAATSTTSYSYDSSRRKPNALSPGTP